MFNLDYAKIVHGNCYDGMLRLLLDGKGLPADLLYLSSFTFLSEVIEHEDWEVSHVFRNDRPQQIALELFGLATRRFTSPLHNIHAIIKNEIATQPVGFWVDPFECEWTPSFKEYHFSHFVLIVDVNQTEQTYRCVDIYFPKIGFFDLSFEEVTKLCRYLDVFGYIGEPVMDKEGLVELLANHLPSINEIESSRDKALEYFLGLDLERIRKVALIPDNKAEAAIISTKDQIEVSRFLTMFGYLSDCKKSFMKAMEQIAIFFPAFEFGEMDSLLNENAVKYALLRSMVMKYAITGKMNTNKIKKIIADIYDVDVRILKILMHLLDSKNGQVDYTEYRPVYEMIDAFALKTPHKISIRHGGETITYLELYEQSNRLARYLRDLGVTKDVLVGVLLDRSITMAVSILAVWKAGGAYVPIDPKYPMERIKTIVSDANPLVLMTHKEVMAAKDEQGYFLDPTNVKQVVFPAEDIPSKYSTEQVDYGIGMSDLCYVIYTSGSEGKPKGAMIEHLGMTNHMIAMAAELGLTEESVIAQNASHCFDISVWQFFNALLVGGQTNIYSDGIALRPKKFLRDIVSEGITILQVVPSYLSVILEHCDVASAGLKHLKYLIVTGEKVPAQLIEKWFQLYPEVKVVNAYGPAEVSDDVTLHIMSKMPDGNQIPVGKPIQNLNVYIVDENMKLCEVGEKGEICVSGIGVGRGYLNDPIKTKRSYTTDSFLPAQSHRMYKTGDYGYWTADGILEYCGRIDNMVKIRGFRIELEEVESVLLQFEGIKNAVVITKEESPSVTYMCAYFTADHAIRVTQLRAFLSSKLPGYMVPRHLKQREALPLNDNGKILRGELM